MDTILYLYKKRDVQKPLVEAISQKTYLLVKIGMDVEPYRWFLQYLPRKRPMPEIDPAEGRHSERLRWLDPGFFRERKELRARRREWKRYEAAIEKLTDRCRGNMESQLAEMMGELSRCVEEYSDRWCMYDRAVREVLFGDNPVAELWQREWKTAEFAGYTELRWIQPLMSRLVSPHFVVLGTAPCIPQLLQQCAGRMKSLKWVIEEAYGQAHREELEDFAENFYQEQGLAVTVEQVQGRYGFERMQLLCREPVNILDFTRGDKIAVGWATKGSVWLDLWASEEKCRRITQRNAGIVYFSLREKWRQAQKISHYLDTVNKNEYNT